MPSLFNVLFLHFYTVHVRAPATSWVWRSKGIFSCPVGPRNELRPPGFMASAFTSGTMLLACNGCFECITDLFLKALEGFLGHHWYAQPRAWCTLCGFGYYCGRFQDYETALQFPCVYISLPLQVRNGLWFCIESGGKNNNETNQPLTLSSALCFCFCVFGIPFFFVFSFFLFLWGKEGLRFNLPLLSQCSARWASAEKEASPQYLSNQWVLGCSNFYGRRERQWELPSDWKDIVY